MTIKELAERVGVSPAMISRYLNNGYVSEENRAKIAAAIQETGFTPSRQARNLRTGKTSLVGVVVPRISTATIGRVTAGVDEVLKQHGYQMLLANTDHDASLELDYLKLFERYPVDGLILVATEVTTAHESWLRKTSTPTVVVGQQVSGVNCVYHDDRGAARELGRRVGEAHPGAKVGLVWVSEKDRAVGVDRRDGLLAGLAEAGIDVPENRRRECDFRSESGYEGARSLLEDHPDVGVICCATDVVAAGAMKAVYEKFGRPAGLDGAPVVTGFGDNELVQDVSGGFPTVHLGYRTSGVRGAGLLFSLMDNPKTMPASTMLGYRVVNA